MMRIHLYCPYCLAEASKVYKKGFECVPPILSDIYELLNDGIYTVHCPKGHTGKVVLNNLHFELLFDLGINAIGDGYYHEAVVAITAALERYYEFFVKTVWYAQGVGFDVIDKNWRVMSNQSERQLGAYIVSYSYAFGQVAPIMPNNLTKFRNSIIHKGELPTREKTIEYAKVILSLIDGSLAKLRAKYSDAVTATSDYYTPHYESANEDEVVLKVNHLTIIRATEGFTEGDQRYNRDIEHLVSIVLKDRVPRRIWLVGDKESKLIRENYEEWLAGKLQKQNDSVEQNELQVIIDPEATAEDCLNALGDQLEENDSLWRWLAENNPDLFNSDMLTVNLANVQLRTNLYYLYLQVRLYQMLLNANPEDVELKAKYEAAEQCLREFHSGLSTFE